MFVRGTWRIGKIGGIEVAVHPSWLIIYALFAWSATVAAQSLPDQRNNVAALGRGALVELGLVYSLLLFASVVVHEYAHAFVARRQGIPIGNVTLFLFGGVASIKREPGSAEDELRMAAAGPAASILLSLLFAAVAWPLPERMVWANDLFWFLSFSNLVLAIFNLLPAFPNDGGRVLRALLWRIGRSQARATTNASIVSFAVAALLVVAGLYFALLGERAAPHTYIAVRGWWWILIGLFLGQAALASMRAARANLILETMPVQECMATTIIPVPANTTIAGFVAEMAVNGRVAGYPVVDDGRLIGLVTLQDAAVVPYSLWQQTPITAVMTVAERTPGIPASTPAHEALASLDHHHVGELPVFQDGALTGVVSKATIFAALRMRERAARA